MIDFIIFYFSVERNERLLRSCPFLPGTKFPSIGTDMIFVYEVYNLVPSNNAARMDAEFAAVANIMRICASMSLLKRNSDFQRITTFIEECLIPSFQHFIVVADLFTLFERFRRDLKPKTINGFIVNEYEFDEVEPLTAAEFDEYIKLTLMIKEVFLRGDCRFGEYKHHHIIVGVHFSMLPLKIISTTN